MMEKTKLTESQLKQLLELAEKATPTPWYLRRLDDTYAMTLVAISTVEDTGKCERWPNFDSKEIIAATLIQEPRYVGVGDEKWDENAEYIIAAAQALPALIEEILELRQQKHD